MQKKYIVKLTPEERAELAEVVRKLKGTSQKVKRAQILLKADSDGPGWTDAKIADQATRWQARSSGYCNAIRQASQGLCELDV